MTVFFKVFPKPLISNRARREVQPLNRQSPPPRTPAVPNPTNPVVLRILGFVRSGTGRFPPTNWFGRTGLFRGAAPRAVKGTQVSRCCNPGSHP
jgi:hypothetical protein